MSNNLHSKVDNYYTFTPIFSIPYHREVELSLYLLQSHSSWCSELYHHFPSVNRKPKYNKHKNFKQKKYTHRYPKKHKISGAPQGSRLGPLLFVVHLKDIVYSSRKSKIPTLFANDSNIQCIIF